MEKIDIIYFTLFPWDHPYSSVSFSFAKEFIKSNRVFYVNPPYSYRDFMTRLNDKETRKRMSDLLLHRMRYEMPPQLEDSPHKENFVGVMPPMIPPINFLNSGDLYRKIRARNNRKVLDCIHQVIKDHNIKKYIFINCYNPFYGTHLPRPEFNPLLNIYQCIDDISQNVYTVKHGVQLEKETIQKADITTVTGSELKNIWAVDAQEIHLVPNAADIDLFKRTLNEKFERPAEIKDIKTKIIGFVGNLDNQRINYPLIKRIAEEHSDKTLLMIGPINNTEVAELKIDKMPNVIFTGSKDINDLPPYLHFFDVAMIPFLKNKLTKSIYPLKINEYLAAGRAVVASDFSEDILTFSDVINIARNDDQFVDLIGKSIAENTPEKVEERVAVANSNTWTARVSQLWEIVNARIGARQTI